MVRGRRWGVGGWVSGSVGGLVGGWLGGWGVACPIRICYNNLPLKILDCPIILALLIYLFELSYKKITDAGCPKHRLGQARWETPKPSPSGGVQAAVEEPIRTHLWRSTIQRWGLRTPGILKFPKNNQLGTG